MINLEEVIQQKTYDLFITKIENNIVKEYCIYEDRHNIQIECIAHFKIEITDIPDYANNYKIENGVLVELTDEEKEAIVTPVTPDQNVILSGKVTALEEKVAILENTVNSLVAADEPQF